MASLDKWYMSLAIKLAQEAALRNEVPVGAVLVVDGKLVGWGRNDRANQNNILGHAELLALQQASETLGNWRLRKSTLYVTLEPCIMCTGALIQARVDRVVFGCRDVKMGGMRSLYALAEDPRMNHRIRIDEGLMAEESSKILREFFDKLRMK